MLYFDTYLGTYAAAVECSETLFARLVAAVNQNFLGVDDSPLGNAERVAIAAKEELTNLLAASTVYVETRDETKTDFEAAEPFRLDEVAVEAILERHEAAVLRRAAIWRVGGLTVSGTALVAALNRIKALVEQPLGQVPTATLTAAKKILAADGEERARLIDEFQAERLWKRYRYYNHRYKYGIGYGAFLADTVSAAVIGAELRELVGPKYGPAWQLEELLTEADADEAREKLAVHMK